MNLGVPQPGLELTTLRLQGEQHTTEPRSSVGMQQVCCSPCNLRVVSSSPGWGTPRFTVKWNVCSAVYHKGEKGAWNRKVTTKNENYHNAPLQKHENINNNAVITINSALKCN